MAITLLVHNFSNFNDPNIFPWSLIDLEKDLMAIILVMTIKIVKTWELKHHKTQNNVPSYFNDHYYMQMVLSNSNLMIKLDLELVQWPLH